MVPLEKVWEILDGKNGAKNVMLIFNFTNITLIPPGTHLVIPRKKKKKKGIEIGEFENANPKEIVEKLREKGWKIKDIFFEWKKKRKNDEIYILYRVKVPMKKMLEDDIHFLKKLMRLLETRWEICRIYFNPESPDKSLTINFAHIVPKSKIQKDNSKVPCFLSSRLLANFLFFDKI